MSKLKEKHVKLIEGAGGKIEEGLFVVKPGVMITKKSGLTNEAKTLFEAMNIDTTEDETSQHAEFNSRLTYLSFKGENSSSRQYNDDMINKYGHLSVYNDEYVTFLVAGCSVETELEFIAHNEASVARLTSSKTAAQNSPLFRVMGTSMGYQKDLIKEQLLLKEKYEKDIVRDSQEIFNMNTFGTKAVSFTITMSLKDWHKTLIGRLSGHGVEIEVLEIMEYIAIMLKKEYPYLIKTVREYYEMGNAKKYSL